jgi:hypothetical protein
MAVVLMQKCAELVAKYIQQYEISAEVLFGDLDQRLSIRYDAGSSAEAYVEDALLAIRKVGTFT